MAALLFDRKMYAAATLVYGWCRYCDDFIDSAPVQSADELQKRVAELERRTRSALEGEIQIDPVFEGLQKVAQEYAIPAEYPLDLIKGLENGWPVGRFTLHSKISNFTPIAWPEP